MPLGLRYTRNSFDAGGRVEQGRQPTRSHVTQAGKGCGFDFLDAAFDGPVAEPEIFWSRSLLLAPGAFQVFVLSRFTFQKAL